MGKVINYGKKYGVLIGVITSIIGLFPAWPTLQTYLVDERVIWVKKVTPVYPTDATANMPLPFKMSNIVSDGVDLAPTSASILELELKNRGDVDLGTQSDLWQLTISSSTKSSLLVLAQESQAVPFDYPKTVQKIDVELNVGLLNRGESLPFRLLILNDPNPAKPSLSVTKWSLKGLPVPDITHQTLRERIQGKIFWWALVVVTVFSVIGFIFEHRADSTAISRYVLIQRLSLYFGGTLLLAAIVTSFLAWLVSVLI